MVFLPGTTGFLPYVHARPPRIPKHPLPNIRHSLSDEPSLQRPGSDVLLPHLSVQILVLSDKYEEIATHVNNDIRRGVTVIDGMGWYSKQPKKVLMILAKRNESVKIFRLIKSIDPKAFISQSNVVGVYGEGFDKIKA